MGCTRRHMYFAFALTVGSVVGSISGPMASYAGQELRTAALSSHDGVYAVDIATQRGGCDRVYHWKINVINGRISSPADGMMQASGEINAGGVVSVAFRRNEHVANVAGKVAGGNAWGTWSSPTLQCGGSWSAARQ